jgi:hypothetical protein
MDAIASEPTSSSPNETFPLQLSWGILLRSTCTFTCTTEPCGECFFVKKKNYIFRENVQTSEHVHVLRRI